MNRFLTVSRALIEFAISLHMLVLSLIAKLHDRAVTKAMKNTDLSITVKYAAEDRLRLAQRDVIAMRAAEERVRKSATNYRIGAAAEASGYGRALPIL